MARDQKPQEQLRDIGPVVGLDVAQTRHPGPDASLIGYNVPAFRQQLSTATGSTPGPRKGRKPAMD